MNELLLYRGDKVSHQRYGPGIVLDQWGSWFSCRSCYVELKLTQLHKIIRFQKEVVTGQCDECAAKALYSLNQDDSAMFPLQVSGKGTFDVLFADGKTRAINQHWLKLIEQNIAA